MKRYAISRYLTDDQKRAMLARRYRRDRTIEGALFAPRTEDGACPLGVAFPEVGPTPDPAELAEYLHPTRREAYPEIYDAAATFICDWDRNKIPRKHLPAALGVTP